MSHLSCSVVQHTFVIIHTNSAILLSTLDQHGQYSQPTPQGLLNTDSHISDLYQAAEDEGYFL